MVTNPRRKDWANVLALSKYFQRQKLKTPKAMFTMILLLGIMNSFKTDEELEDGINLMRGLFLEMAKNYRDLQNNEEYKAFVTKHKRKTV
jgi:hypothetical protein